MTSRWPALAVARMTCASGIIVAGTSCAEFGSDRPARASSHRAAGSVPGKEDDGELAACRTVRKARKRGCDRRAGCVEQQLGVRAHPAEHRGDGLRIPARVRERREVPVVGEAKDEDAGIPRRGSGPGARSKAGAASAARRGRSGAAARGSGHAGDALRLRGKRAHPGRRHQHLGDADMRRHGRDEERHGRDVLGLQKALQLLLRHRHGTVAEDRRVTSPGQMQVERMLWMPFSWLMAWERAPRSRASRPCSRAPTGRRCACPPWRRSG